MIDFDPAKEAINLAKHGVSLARSVDLDIKRTFVDDRRDYGEIRYRAYGFIEGVRVLPDLYQPKRTGAADQSQANTSQEDEALCPVS
jgi:uncharacterized DUF497 family protein